MGIRRVESMGARRPRVALRPTRPHHAAGIRMEPPPSPPWAMGTTFAATSAAAPPEEPPGVRVRSTGLRVGRPCTGSVVQVRPNSAVVLLPRATGAGGHELRHAGRGAPGHRGGEGGGAVEGGRPDEVLHVLHEGGDPREAPLAGQAGLREALLVEGLDDGGEVGLPGLGPLDGGPGGLLRAHLALRDAGPRSRWRPSPGSVRPGGSGGAGSTGPSPGRSQAWADQKRNPACAARERPSSRSSTPSRG
jgi:hypothetical protein